MSRNLGWFQRDDRAPTYLLIDYLTIDGRYPAQDDALLVADLPLRYEPVLTERNLLLARRRATQPPANNLPREVVTRGGIKFGENIEVPPFNKHALWLKLDPAPTGLGRLRAALYKPPELRLVLREEDDVRADILVEGCRRVLVGERFELHRYESGRVIDFADLSSDWDEALANRVYSLHRQLLVTVTGDEPPDALYHQREALSWVVAACCGLDASDKIDLLLLRDENERLRRVLAALERLHPQLAAAMPKIHGILASYAMTRLAGEAG
jgi:hypothetical protein